MSNISFVIFTFNEEERIEHVICNFKKYGEVLIMDDGSTDNTKAICEQYGAKYFIRPKTPSVGDASGETKNLDAANQNIYDFIKSKVQTEWMFWGFADNLAPKTLLDKLEEISKQEKIKYVEIPIYTYLWGDTKNVAHKGYSPVFFRKDFVDFANNKIHGMGQFKGKPDEKLRLANRYDFAIRHYSLYNTDKFILAHLKYGEIEAQQNFQNGKKFSALKMILAMIRYFFLFYRTSYKSGVRGFMTSFSYAVFRFIAHSRVYELENDLTLKNMESEYAKSKKELLKQFN